MIIFCLEIPDVILGIDSLDILRKLMERLCCAGLIGELQSKFRQCVVCLESGEDKGVISEGVCQFLRSLLRNGCADGPIEDSVSLPDMAHDFRTEEHFVGEPSLLMQELHDIVEDARIETDAFILALRKLQLCSVIQEVHSPVEDPVKVCLCLFLGLFLILGALLLILAPYSKKPSDESLSPMMSMLYFSWKYFGSIL